MSTMSLNDISSSKEGKGLMKMDQGIAVFRWQAAMARSQGSLQAIIIRYTVSNKYGMNILSKRQRYFKMSKRK